MDMSTAGVMIIVSNHQSQLITEYRKRSYVDDTLRADFPGGWIETFDRSPAHAAMRELNEEGLSDVRLTDYYGALGDPTTQVITHVFGGVNRQMHPVLAYERPTSRSHMWIPLTPFQIIDWSPTASHSALLANIAVGYARYPKLHTSGSKSRFTLFHPDWKSFEV